MSATLCPADLNQRCDILNDKTVAIRAVRTKQTGDLAINYEPSMRYALA